MSGRSITDEYVAELDRFRRPAIRPRVERAKPPITPGPTRSLGALVNDNRLAVLQLKGVVDD